MDDIVRQAMAKWPNVPFAYGWLGLDARGAWYLRDAGAQAAGGFASGVAPAKGSLIEHAKLLSFIGRNYQPDDDGQWFFQNGPQRAYVELEVAPHVFRFGAESGNAAADALALTSHTGAAAVARACLVDERGWLYFDSDIGLGLLHSLEVSRLADLIEQGHWQPETVAAATLPKRFGFVLSPAAQQPAAVKK
ncbi:MAG: DUF2946 family protein [Burkholderiales bacterium]